MTSAPGARLQKVSEKGWVHLVCPRQLGGRSGVSQPYDTDLNDLAWAVVEPQLPAALPGGRPRTTNLRAVVNAIFYSLRTGCQWRLLPREYPPRSTVYHYFSVWRA